MPDNENVVTRWPEQPAGVDVIMTAAQASDHRQYMAALAQAKRQGGCVRVRDETLPPPIPEP
jgi:hypothetical protein